MVHSAQLQRKQPYNLVSWLALYFPTNQITTFSFFRSNTLPIYLFSQLNSLHSASWWRGASRLINHISSACAQPHARVNDWPSQYTAPRPRSTHTHTHTLANNNNHNNHKRHPLSPPRDMDGLCGGGHAPKPFNLSPRSTSNINTVATFCARRVEGERTWDGPIKCVIRWVGVVGAVAVFGWNACARVLVISKHLWSLRRRSTNAKCSMRSRGG